MSNCPICRKRFPLSAIGKLHLDFEEDEPTVEVKVEEMDALRTKLAGQEEEVGRGRGGLGLGMQPWKVPLVSASGLLGYFERIIGPVKGGQHMESLSVECTNQYLISSFTYS